MAYDYKVTVQLDVDAVSGGRPRRTGQRTFVVHYDADGKPLRIKEVVQMHRPSRLEERSYWSPRSHPLVGLAVRIIAVAREKQRAEDRNADATP